MTDLHMNRYPALFNRRLLTKAADSDMLIVLGDITTGDRTGPHLHELTKYNDDVRFVLGNHDFYTSSFDETSVRVKAICGNERQGALCWLDDSNPIDLGGETWLVGVDGWYDGNQGDSFFMDVNFDRMLIKDLLVKRRREDRAALISSRSQLSADKFSRKMTKVPSSASRIIIATHYPPWMGPITSLLDAFWLPQSVNGTLAQEILSEASRRGSAVQFEVFCGHVHSKYEVRPAENVVCRVLEARKPHFLTV